jgi:hypothetical protein
LSTVMALALATAPAPTQARNRRKADRLEVAAALKRSAVRIVHGKVAHVRVAAKELDGHVRVSGHAAYGRMHSGELARRPHWHLANHEEEVGFVGVLGIVIVDSGSSSSCSCSRGRGKRRS